MRKIQRGSASQPERWMTEFADSLRREDLSATTVRGYLHDLTLCNVRLVGVAKNLPESSRQKPSKPFLVFSPGTPINAPDKG